MNSSPLKSLFLFTLIGFILVTINGCHREGRQDMGAKSYSLYKVLDDYGYGTDSQKQALDYLLAEAGILAEGQSFQERFPDRDNCTDFQRDMLEFIHLTQERFTIRKGTQERWEIKASEWMEKDKAQNIKAIKALGFVEEVLPTADETDMICILGGTLTSMKSRLAYAEKLIDQGNLKAKYLVLLAGERKVTTQVDGGEVDLLRIAKKHGVDGLAQLTETHLMKEAYGTSTLEGKLETHLIDTPAGTLPRPTTETSIGELINWLDKHGDVKRVVFVSSQPYVQYQRAVIGAVLKQRNCVVEFQVIGPQEKKDLTILALVGALGSQLWAKTPIILRDRGEKITDAKLVARFKALYAKQAIIYKNIEPLLG